MYQIDNLKFEDFETAVETSVSVLTTVTTVLAASGKRQWFNIRNLSDTAVTISFGNSAMALSTGMRLEKLGTANNDSFQMKDGSMFVGTIYGKAGATGKKLSVIYYNREGGFFDIPSPSPSISSSVSPSPSPSVSPSASPSTSPSSSPSASPSSSPSASPSTSPSSSPSESPSSSPSASLSVSPSASPSESPSASLSVSPSASPSVSLSVSPSVSPSASQSISPSPSPSVSQSVSPSI